MEYRDGCVESSQCPSEYYHDMVYGMLGAEYRLFIVLLLQMLKPRDNLYEVCNHSMKVFYFSVLAQE